MPIFCWVPVARSFVCFVDLSLSFCPFLKVIVLCVFRLTAYDYSFVILKLVLLGISMLSLQYETGTTMNARESENYLAISRSSSASKSVEIFWAEIYRGPLFLRANIVSFKSNCRSLRNLKS